MLLSGLEIKLNSISLYFSVSSETIALQNYKLNLYIYRCHHTFLHPDLPTLLL